MYDSRRFLNFPELLNARDLGGYPTRDGRQTRWRSVLRADDLVQLTPAGVQAVGEFGVQTVIDLRWPEEVACSPSPITKHLDHVRYEQISLLARTPAEWMALQGECTKEMWKCTVLKHSRAEVRDVLRVMAGASPSPVLFHCVAGKDRTGIIAALMLALADVEPEAIAWDYAASSERLREAYLARHSNLTREEILEAVRCPEEGVHNMLRYLDELGGIRTYLEQIGLSKDEIRRLYFRLRD